MLCAGLGLVHGAQAQDDGGSTARAGLRVQPSIGLGMTATDNLRLGSGAEDAALITVVTPRIIVSNRTGRLQGSLDYALNGVLYTKSDAKSEALHSLAAQGRAELVEQHLYVDARASIGQQSQSAFGQQTTDANLANPNRVEVASLSVSPYLLGRIGNFADVQLRGNAQETRAKDSVTGDSRGFGGSLRLDGLSSGQLRWWGMLSSQRSESGLTRSEYTNSLLNLGLRWRPDVDFDLGVNGGPERNDYQGGGARNSSNYGVSASWTPSPRTKVIGDYQHHDYGNGHTLSVEHRLARSSFRYTDTQSVTLGDQNNGFGGPRTNYDLMSLLLGGIADPVQRDIAVRAELQKLGLNPDSTLGTAFLSSAPTLSRRQELSWLMTGLRYSATVVLSQSTISRLSPVGAGGGDLEQNTRVVTRGGALTLGYKLTPTSNASVSLTEQRASGDSAAQSTRLRSISGSWTGQLGSKLSFLIGARHAEFDGNSSPYTENAVFANLVQQY